MKRGLLTYLRRLRRVPALLVILSFLAPLLAGIAPAAASDAERALLAAIARSYCQTASDAPATTTVIAPIAEAKKPAGQGHTEDQGQSTGHSSSPCCILCTPLNLATPDMDHLMIAVPVDFASHDVSFDLADQTQLLAQHVYRVMAPRGPPSLI